MGENPSHKIILVAMWDTEMVEQVVNVMMLQVYLGY